MLATERGGSADGWGSGSLTGPYADSRAGLARILCSSKAGRHKGVPYLPALTEYAGDDQPETDEDGGFNGGDADVPLVVDFLDHVDAEQDHALRDDR